MADTEVSLKAFVDSSWFRGLFRGAVIVLTFVVVPGVGYIAWTLRDVRNQQQATAGDLSEVQETQELRANDSEAFQTEVRGEITELNGRFGRMDDKLDVVSEDVATIKGILLRGEIVVGLTGPPR